MFASICSLVLLLLSSLEHSYYHTFNTQGFSNPAAGIESVFGTLTAYFESQPIRSIMYVDKHNTVHLKNHLVPGDVEKAIESI